MRRLGAILAALLLGVLPVHAQEEACPPPEGLGQVILPPAPCFDGISANFERPEPRYGHNVLGPGFEFASMMVETKQFRIRVNQPVTQVFEDLAPRLADLDGDGDPEIVVVEAYLAGGAILAAYDIDGRDVKRIAGTRPIGQRFRWLAPVGIADFDGDGSVDIAYVETPHLGKTLKIVSFRGGGFVELVSEAGFSNHRLGEPFFEGGIRDCGTGPEIITANADWTQIVATTFDGQSLSTTDLAPYTGPESFAPILACAS